MVDTTNLNIFGITVALAWQLPHKTVFEASRTEEPMHDSRISVTSLTKKSDEPQALPALQMDHFTTYYNRSNYHFPKMNSNYLNYLQTVQHFIRPPINKQNVHTNDWNKYRINKPKWNHSHHIYPALRMRRHIAIGASHYHQDNNRTRVHPEVEQHMNHHRDTRFDLYKSIEKYLNAYGAILC